ncbi:MAG: beta strand repeat-containing protein, partial [Alphaproteobacteria bacterium]
DGANLIFGEDGADSLIGGNDSDTISSGIGADSILGGTGADSIIGMTGGDSLESLEPLSDGNDTVLGGSGADTIGGGNSDDVIQGDAGADSIFGNDGTDTISGGDDADTIFGGAGADEISGGIGNDLLQGGVGNDTLSGGDGDDTLDGGDPADGLDDTLAGGLGNDFYIAPEAVVFDAGGSDTVSMLGGGVGTISASAGDLDGSPGIEAIDLAGSGRLLGLTAEAVRSLSDTEVLRVFGSGNDSLVFEDESSWTRGATDGGFVTYTTSAGGNATVIAAESLVSATSGPTTGNDTLSGSAGADTIDMLAGNDSYLGLDGNDSILGNTGNDTLSGGNGADTLNGGTGNDSLDAGAGNDLLSYGDASGAVTVNLAAGTAGASADSIAGFESAQGSGFADSLLGDSGANGLHGEAGTDTLSGQGGADTIYGGAGADSISGGDGDDRIYGEAGNDTIDLGAGTNDRVLYSHTGGPAITATITNDGSSSGVNRATVTSSDGTDSIQGFEILVGSGVGDQITVNSAATTNAGLFVFGNGGNDTIISNITDNAVFADYNSPISTTTSIVVDLTSGTASDGQGGTDSLVGIRGVSATSFDDTLLGSAGNDRFRAWQGNDSIDGRGGSEDIVDYQSNSSAQAISVNLAAGRAGDGFGGTDTLVGIEQVRGGSGNDTIIGDGGDNLVRGNSGSDSLDGGAGFDIADYSNNTSGQAISVNLTAGRASDGLGGTDTLVGIEYIRGGSGNDTIIGDGGDNLVRGNSGSDSLDGDAGFDIADYSNNTSGQAISVNLTAGRANDGLGGTDTLSGIENVWGGAGNDTIIGGDGADSLWGNSGDDTLVGGNGADTLDGGSGNDTITGGDGSDRIFGGTGSDSIDAGAGTSDIVSFNHTSAQAVSATISAVGGSSGYNYGEVTTSSQGNDTVVGFENIQGSFENDIFIINSAATDNALLTVFGSIGADTIAVNSSSNAVMADYNTITGSTNFTRGVVVDLTAGTADDGRGGIDSLIGVRGVNGSSFGDTILGSGFNDRFREQGGSDSINGRDGLDMLDYSGNSASQSVSVNLAAERASDGRGGTDTVISMEYVRSGSGNDTLIGNAADNELRGGSGADILDGGVGGFDIADYANNTSAQAISVNLTTGRASDGFDFIDTLSGIEYIRGGSGNDTMIGSATNERFRGNAGDDTIDGLDGTEDLLDLSLIHISEPKRP